MRHHRSRGNNFWRALSRAARLYPSFLATTLLLVPPTLSPAQQISVPTPGYRPGRYVPLRINADAAGLVRVRGDGVQGVDWPAPGRGSAVVPLLVYDSTPTLTVDGRDVPVALTALGDADADPPELEAFWQAVDPLPPAGPAFDADLAAEAGLWQPPHSPAVRTWTLMAIGIVVLTLGIAAHADPKRATRWLALAAVGSAIGLAWLRPADPARRELRAEGRPGWQAVWHAGNDGATGNGLIEEPWTAGLRYLPASADALRAAAPVLRCDPAGRPVGIRAGLRGDERAVFLRLEGGEGR